jgi:hypothetical protein
MALAHLFRSTVQAHHRAFAATNGEDRDWPNWYARELAGPLSSLLGSTVEPEYLAKALGQLDQDMRRRVLSVDWTLYYADWFLAASRGAGRQLRGRGGAPAAASLDRTR